MTDTNYADGARMPTGNRSLRALLKTHESVFKKEPKQKLVFDGRRDLLYDPDAVFVDLGLEGGNRIVFISRGNAPDLFGKNETIEDAMRALRFRVTRSLEETTCNGGCGCVIRKCRVTKKGWYR